MALSHFDGAMPVPAPGERDILAGAKKTSVVEEKRRWKERRRLRQFMSGSFSGPHDRLITGVP
jgi:hypothetical protein